MSAPEGSAAPHRMSRPRSVQRALTQFHFLLTMVAARLRANRNATAAIVAGVALGTASFAVALAGGVIIHDHHVLASFENLAASQRTVRIAHFGVIPGERSYQDIDRVATETARRVTGHTPTRLIQFRALRLGHAEATLVALDEPARAVKLVQGSMPRPCTPRRCELVVVGDARRVGDSAIEPDPPLVIVGRVTKRAGSPLAGLELAVAGDTAEQRETSALLLGRGVEALSSAPSLSAIYRTYSWSAQIGRPDTHPWSVGPFARSVAQARPGLHRVSDGFEVEAPTEKLLAADAAGGAAATRLELVAGSSAILLLAFVVFVGSTISAREREARRRLVWHGARFSQVSLITGGYALAVVGCGVMGGWGIGLGGAALAARKAGLPPGAVTRHALLTQPALLIVLTITGAAAALLAAALLARPPQARGHGLRGIDVAAVAAVAGAILIHSGEGDSARASQTTSALLPALVLFVGAVAASRILAPALAAARRLRRWVPPMLFLALTAAARTRSAAGMAAAFVAVSSAVALFGGFYRGTLDRHVLDQAAYEVPVDFVIRERLSPDALVPPLDAAPLTAYASVARGAEAFPVTRLHGTASLIVGTERFTLLGIPPTELTALPRWRHDYASLQPGALATALTERFERKLNLVRLPRDTRAVVLAARRTFGSDDVAINAVLLDGRGRARSIPLGRTRGRTMVSLRAELPRSRTSSGLLGFEFRRVDEVEAHAKGSAPLLRGVLELGAVSVERRAHAATRLVSDYGGWIPVGGARRAPAFGPDHIDYLLGETGDALFRLRQVTDDNPLPAAVAPSLAALADSNGVVTVRVGAGVLDLRVVATLRHLPSVYDDAVLVDGAALSVALAALRAGSVRANEVWVRLADPRTRGRVAAALGKPPFGKLDVRSQQGALTRLRADPLARGTLTVLVVAAILAALMAVAAIGIFTVIQTRDAASELLDLELQGVQPAALRRQVRIRAAIACAPGLVIGFVLASVLEQLVVTFVAATGSGAAAPPIVVSLDWPIALALLAAVGIGGALCVFAVTRRLFADPYQVLARR